MVKNIKKLIENVAKEKDIPAKIVENALKNAIAYGIRKEKHIRGKIYIDFGEDDTITAYIVYGKEKTKLDISTEDLNRIAAYAAKEEFLKELENAERERGFLEYVSQEGNIVHGIVREITKDQTAIVDLGPIDAELPRKEQIPKESFKKNDRVKALLFSVQKERNRPVLLLSRTHPKFLRRLLETEIPEVASGLVKIISVAREPGEKAKVVVDTEDKKIDPVGVVIGIKGSKINPISKELAGEHIDVVRYSEDKKKFLENLFFPAKILDIRETDNQIEVAVDKDQVSLAIGKRGINTKLAYKILGKHIDVMSKEDFDKLKKLS
jgi:N utilization substance protein A